MKIPVYLFTGFLEGGKTSIIQESLADQNFNSGEKTLILLCEEGIEELDPSKFWGKNVTIETIDSEDMITEENLLSYTKGKKIDRIIIEYNGIWLLQRLYDNFPENWGIYQNMMFLLHQNMSNDKVYFLKLLVLLQIYQRDKQI